MKYHLASSVRLVSRSILLVLTFILLSCDGSKTKQIPIDRFEGVWELEGRSMFKNVHVEIKSVADGFEGNITALNDHKYIQFFLEEGDQWISDIRRTSNFEFILTEHKIAKELFTMYELDTKQSYKVQFIDENTFGLSKGSADPKVSKVIYKRVVHN